MKSNTVAREFSKLYRNIALNLIQSAFEMQNILRQTV